jgi:hypothetical protein
LNLSRLLSTSSRRRCCGSSWATLIGRRIPVAVATSRLNIPTQSIAVASSATRRSGATRLATPSRVVAKRTPVPSKRLFRMQIPLGWAEQQFRAMGRRDAHDLAVELVASYQGSAVLTSTLGQPELMARQARRLQRWIEGLHA